MRFLAADGQPLFLPAQCQKKKIKRVLATGMKTAHVKEESARTTSHYISLQEQIDSLMKMFEDMRSNQGGQ